MTPEEIKTILENHKHWILRDCENWKYKCAYLQGASLRGADLQGADLRGAYLQGTDLQDAYLQGASLQGADLQGADLRGAYLQRADLQDADLRDADLRGASLQGADLRDAYLRGASLQGADLRYAKNIPSIPMACPDTGTFIGWKKSAHNKIVKLEIPADAKRLSATGRKCRCDKAVVVAIENIDGTASDIKAVISMYDSSFVYTIGEIVTVSNFDNDRFNECAPGIHFFINRQEAVDYL